MDFAWRKVDTLAGSNTRGTRLRWSVWHFTFAVLCVTVNCRDTTMQQFTSSIAFEIFQLEKSVPFPFEECFSPKLMLGPHVIYFVRVLKDDLPPFGADAPPSPLRPPPLVGQAQYQDLLATN